MILTFKLEVSVLNLEGDTDCYESLFLLVFFNKMWTVTVLQ